VSAPYLWLATSADRRVSVWSSDWTKDFCELVDWLTFPAPAFMPDGSLVSNKSKVKCIRFVVNGVIKYWWFWLYLYFSNLYNNRNIFSIEIPWKATNNISQIFYRRGWCTGLRGVWNAEIYPVLQFVTKKGN
jgi:hypothetical protein